MEGAGKRNLARVDYNEGRKPKRPKKEEEKPRPKKQEEKPRPKKEVKKPGIKKETGNGGKKKILVTEEIEKAGVDRQGRPFVRLRNVRILNKSGTSCMAMDLEQADILLVTGRDESGKTWKSGALMEWFAYSENDQEPQLGVSDQLNNYILEDSAPEYLTLFNHSITILHLGKLIQDQLESSADANLAKVLDTFFASDQNTFGTKIELDELVRDRARSLFAILKATGVAERFPRALCFKQLAKFIRNCALGDDRAASSTCLTTGLPDCVGQLIQKCNPEEKGGETNPLACDEEEADKVLGCLNFVCRPHTNIRWSSNGKAKLKMANGVTKAVSKGDCVRVAVKGGKTVLGQIQYFGPAGTNSAHIQRLCSSSHTLLGDLGDRNEFFLLHQCADVPLQAILGKVDVVFGSSHNRKHFCMYEACTEYGFFQDIQPSFDIRDSCRCCEVDAQLKKFSTPTRVAKTRESFEFEGEAYHCGSFVRLVRASGDTYTSTPEAINKEWTTSQYRRIRPEMWRCSTRQRQILSMKPQLIGQITNIEFSLGDAVSVRLRLFHRAEDLPEGTRTNPHPNWLQFPKTAKFDVVPVSIDAVAGKAFVRFFEPDETSTMNDWLLKGPHRFFVDEFTQPPTTRQDLHNTSLCGYALQLGDVDRKGCMVAPPSWPALPQKRKLKVFDVFCAAGGMALGLEQSGLATIKWGLEKDLNTLKAFCCNFPNATPIYMGADEFLTMFRNGQTESSHPSRGKVDLLCGGPPCQGFSRLNRKRSSADSRQKRSGIITFLGLVEVLDPKFVLIENVESLVQYNNGAYMQFVMQALLRLGYQCRANCLQAANFGVPQDRKRVFVLAAKQGEELPEFPDATHCFSKTKDSLMTLNNIEIENTSVERGAALRTLLAVEAIADLPAEASNLMSPRHKYKSQPANPFQHLMRQGSETLLGHTVLALSALNEARINLIPAGGNWWHLPNIRLELSDGTFTSIIKYYKIAKGCRSVVCPCHMGGSCMKEVLKVKNRNSLLPFGTVHSAYKKQQESSSFSRIGTNHVFPTTVTSSHMCQTQGKVIHPTANRLLTVRERGRSQALPDTFHVWGTLQDQTTQIGNAVPPPLTFHLGQMIVRSLLKKT